MTSNIDTDAELTRTKVLIEQAILSTCLQRVTGLDDLVTFGFTALANTVKFYGMVPCAPFECVTHVSQSRLNEENIRQATVVAPRSDSPSKSTRYQVVKEDLNSSQGDDSESNFTASDSELQDAEIKEPEIKIPEPRLEARLMKTWTFGNENIQDWLNFCVFLRRLRYIRSRQTHFPFELE